MAIFTPGIDLAEDVFALRGEDSRSIAPRCRFLPAFFECPGGDSTPESEKFRVE